jgi:hypothetical protein
MKDSDLMAEPRNLHASVNNPRGTINFEGISLHNVAELREEAGGWRLQRAPEALRPKLTPMGQDRMLDAAGMELRFVADGPIEVVASCQTDSDQSPCLAMLYHGTFQTWHGRLAPLCSVRFRSEPTTVTLEPAPQPMRLSADVRSRYPFASQVTRLLLPPWAGSVRIHAVKPAPGVSLRPPQPQELPRLTMLSYGTSITQGSGCTSAPLTYVNQCAVRLGVDALNLGSGGSAVCEPEMADHLASRPGWDLATLALSVNMMGFSDEQFRQRVFYMVHTVAGAAPHRPVFAITLWPFFGDHAMNGEGTAQPELAEKVQRFRQHLRDAVAECPTPNVRLLEGPELLRDFGNLSQDLIHPGDNAMIEMGWRLADAIRPHLPQTSA